MYLANVNIGQTVNISCLFQDGFPKPQFKWAYGFDGVNTKRNIHFHPQEIPFFRFHQISLRYFGTVNIPKYFVSRIKE